MAIGIITGSGTYALPGFEGSPPEPVTTEWGDAYVSRGRFAGAGVLHPGVDLAAWTPTPARR